MTSDQDAPSQRGLLNDKTETLTGLLLLPDGRILVHNLTPAMAHILQQLDPGDQILRQRQQLPSSTKPADSVTVFSETNP